MRLWHFGILAVGALALGISVAEMQTRLQSTRDAPVVTRTVVEATIGNTVVSCTKRGIDYFKEIGSWPSLSDGRDAATVAAERCNRTTTAF